MKELVYVAILTLLIVFMDVTGIPGTFPVHFLLMYKLQTLNRFILL